MRTYLGLVSAFALAGGAAFGLSCASDLWNNYVRDSEDSCVRVGCPGGGTCNNTTGFCDGASDMGTAVDMAPFSKGELFKDPAPISSSPSIAATNFYEMSTRTTTSGDDVPEIWLSDLSRNMVRLVSTGAKLAYTSTLVSIDIAPCSLTSAQGASNGRRDLLVPQLGNQYTRVVGSGATLSPRTAMLPAFKLTSISDLNDDGFPDMVLTSSLLKAGSNIYGAGADGKALVFGGNSNYGLDLLTGPSLEGKLISATLEHQPTKGQSGFNLAMISENDVSIAVLSQLGISGGNFSLSSRVQVNIPASDFAIPVDFDRDGLNDLVLVLRWDGASSPSQPAGSVSLARNLGSAGSPSFDKAQILPLPITGGLVLGAHVADFDLDGVPDITVLHADASGNSFLMYRNESSPDLAQRRQFRFFGKMTTQYAPRAVEYIDVNRDGCKDMLMMSSGSAAVMATGVELQVALGKKRGAGQADCP